MIPEIPDSGFVVPIPTLPSSVITRSLLKSNFCVGVAVNIPIFSVLVSILSAVPPIPTSSLVLTKRKSISNSPSIVTSFLKTTSS